INIQQATIPTGTSIEARIGHTATLTPDNDKIIIIGGTSSHVIDATTAYPVFIMLDIRTESYEYSELKDSGIRPRSPLAYHTVNLYQNLIIVAFGNITNDKSESVETSSSIYLLCLPRLEWVTTFTPNYTCPIIPIPLIIGLTIAFYVVFIATTVAIIKINRQPLRDNRLTIIANSSIASIAAIIIDTIIIVIYPPQSIIIAIVSITIACFIAVIIAEIIFLRRKK
ncbi:7346_t:CDS:2, partial [Racocetra persica]